MRRVFPPEIVDFFKANNYGRSAKEMAELLNSTFGTSYTPEQIKDCRARNHWDSGLTGHFEKGHTPHNKGCKGSIRKDTDGYLYKKVAEPNKWRLLHVLNWEAVHGPVPPGHAVIFKDQNRENCDVSNLLLVSRGELAVMNKRKLITENPEATEAGQQLARLLKALTSRKKQQRKKGGST